MKLNLLVALVFHMLHVYLSLCSYWGIQNWSFQWFIVQTTIITFHTMSLIFILSNMLTTKLFSTCKLVFDRCWFCWEHGSLRSKRKREGQGGGGVEKNGRGGLERREGEGALTIKARITPCFYVQNLDVKCWSRHVMWSWKLQFGS